MIDLITNLDMAAFQTHGGLSAFINRLEVRKYLSWPSGFSVKKIRLVIYS